MGSVLVCNLEQWGQGPPQETGFCSPHWGWSYQERAPDPHHERPKHEIRTQACSSWPFHLVSGWSCSLSYLVYTGCVLVHLCAHSVVSNSAPLSMGFSRQESWSAFLLQVIFLTQGIFPNAGISCLGRRTLNHWATWEARVHSWRPFNLKLAQIKLLS